VERDGDEFALPEADVGVANPADGMSQVAVAPAAASILGPPPTIVVRPFRACNGGSPLMQK
jgi:hypothetical protein